MKLKKFPHGISLCYFLILFTEKTEDLGGGKWKSYRFAALFALSCGKTLETMAMYGDMLHTCDICFFFFSYIL